MPSPVTEVNACVSLQSMSVESSPYEGQLDRLNGKFCLAIVTAVDADNRFLTCRSIGSLEAGTDDQYLPNVKIGHIAWNTNGCYGVYIPQIGEYIVVAFINSEPISLCSYPLSDTTVGGQPDNQVDDLQPGDWAIVGIGQAIGGSRIIMRSAGTVEIESTKGCRTYWLPMFDTINTVCQNYELEPTGGYLHWTVDPDTAVTVLDLKAYDTDEADNAVRLQLGTADSGALVDLALGATDDNLDIPTPNLSLQIQPDGTTALNIGQGKITINMTPDGNVTVSIDSDLDVTVKGKVSLDVTGDVDATIEGKTSVTSTGDVEVTTDGDATVKATGTTTIKGLEIILNEQMSGITTMNSHLGVIDLITGAPVIPSTTVFGDI